MTDRELLELAAKAAGVKYDAERSKPHHISGAWWGLWLVYEREPHEFDRRYWNPLTDDGDRYRLLSKLKMNIDFESQVVTCETVCISWPDGEPDDVHAVVRAAAEIGRAKVSQPPQGEN